MSSPIDHLASRDGRAKAAVGGLTAHLTRARALSPRCRQRQSARTRDLNGRCAPASGRVIMPLYSDHITNMYYGGSPSYTGLPYSYGGSVSPLGSSYSASYLNPGGNYSNHSSLGYSRTPISSRWVSSVGRSYSPMLSTISERGTGSPVRISSPRRIPISKRTYGSPGYISRPININTADIDVSRDKYRHKIDSPPIVNFKSSPKKLDSFESKDQGPFMPRVDGKPETGIDSSPGTQRSTIKRGRTVVRLHTIKRRERDSPRKPSEENKTDKNDDATPIINEPTGKMEDDSAEIIGWREKLSEDLIYKGKKEKKSLGTKLVEKFIIKGDDSDVIINDSIKRQRDTQTLPITPLTNIDSYGNKSPDRRCSMELLAEQASLLDSLIRRENLSTTSLDLTKVGVNDLVRDKEENIQLFNKTSCNLKNPLKTTKSDHSLHDNLKCFKDSRQISKRRSLKKSSSGGSICRLDSITEFPKEINLSLPSIEESNQLIKKEVSKPKPKLRAKITSSVEVSPPKSPLKFKVENVTVEEIPRVPKKEIVYSAFVEDDPTQEKSENDINRNSKTRKSIKKKVKNTGSIKEDVIATDPEEDNFWDKIGKRETVYLTKRKQNLDDAREKNKRALFWFPEEEPLTNCDKNNTTEEFNANVNHIENKIFSDIEHVKDSVMKIDHSNDISTSPDQREVIKEALKQIDIEPKIELIHQCLESLNSTNEGDGTKVNFIENVDVEIEQQSADTTIKDSEEPIPMQATHDTNKKEEVANESLSKKIIKDKIYNSIEAESNILNDEKEKCKMNGESNLLDNTSLEVLRNKDEEIKTNDFLSNNKQNEYEVKEVKTVSIGNNEISVHEKSTKIICVQGDRDSPDQNYTDHKLDTNSVEVDHKNLDASKIIKKSSTKDLEKNAPTSLKKLTDKIEVNKENNDVKKLDSRTSSQTETKHKKIKVFNDSKKEILQEVKVTPSTSNKLLNKEPDETILKDNIVCKADVESDHSPLSTESTKDKEIDEKRESIKESNTENIPSKNDVNTCEIAVQLIKLGEDGKADNIPKIEEPKDDTMLSSSGVVKLPQTPSPRRPVKEEPALRPLIATPRPLQKKVPQVIHSSSSSESSSEEDSSDDDDADESDSSEGSAEFYECENNTDGRTSTGSNDSGFDSSAPTSPAGFVQIKKGGESPGTSTSTAHAHSDATDILEQELEQSTAYGLFRKTGRFTPPARSIPRFRKYAIEDFHFIKVLGKGSFGKVLLAELRETEYYYAVKCLKKDVVLEDDDVECTLIERKVLALGTNHPYLCHLFATFQTESHLFFVMEYLNGGDLMFHIQQSGRFPEARGRFYAAEIVSGLKFLHKRGIVYRDLKLDNILLDFDGHVRIADFGMCKLQIYLEKTADTFCGTPDYMAPEIIKGLKYNQTVDWWSFGVLLYEMLIGQSPFSGCDEDELFWSICNEVPSYPRFLSQDALTILTRLLDKDARSRLGGAECMHGDIRDQEFFRPIHWDRLERRELEAPFKPRVRHPLDTQYFDRAFTGERPRLTAVEPQVLRSMDQEPFRGFSYTNPNATDR